jgi:hypothetical protein
MQMAIGAYLLLTFLLCVSFTNAQVTGSGQNHVVPVWTGTTSLGDSPIVASGGNVAIGTTSVGGKLSVSTASATLPAIYGISLASSGFTNGILGLDLSSNGVGVQGMNSGTSGIGVQGINNGPNGGWGMKGFSNSLNSVGVEGFSPTVGVRGQSLLCASTCTPQTGEAGQFIVASGGTLLHGFVSSSSGQWTSVFRVDSTGEGFFDGGTQTGGADFAESVMVAKESGKHEPGDVLVVDDNAKRQLKLSSEPYSTLVAGVYSTKPGVLATNHRIEQRDSNEIPLAIVGIVPCKVSAENGAIRAGDLLVASSTPGYAMKGSDRGRMLGAVIGKALEPLNDGKGTIQVLLTLQ